MFVEADWGGALQSKKLKKPEMDGWWVQVLLTKKEVGNRPEIVQILVLIFWDSIRKKSGKYRY